jgi:hypothetical protein
MPKPFKIIRIPRTPPANFNKDRVASDLIKNQVRHAHEQLQEWIAKYGGIDPESLETEQQAAEYLAIVTRVLHPEVASKPALPEGRPAKSGISLTVAAPRPQPPQSPISRRKGPKRRSAHTKRTTKRRSSRS